MESKNLFTFQVIIVVFLVNLNGAQKPAPHKGENVCQYLSEKMDTILRKNITTTTEYYNKKCGVPSQPDLVCPETRVKSRIYWYPIQKKRKLKIYKCCPGWTGYIQEKGCTQRLGCTVSLPQNADATCQYIRGKRLAYEQKFYKLTTPKPEDSRSVLDIAFPVLNQTTESVLMRAMLDPFTAHWFNVYFQGMLMRNNKTFSAVMKRSARSTTFASYDDYKMVFKIFTDSVVSTGLPYFKLPSLEPGFRSIMTNDSWQSDKYFVEQRLAGLNPMALQKVTMDGSAGMKWDELKSKLNPSFELEKALQDAIGVDHSLSSAIEKGLLYITYYPIYHDIPHVADITDYNTNDKLIMKNSSSPIGIFAVGKDGEGQNELKAVAIQWDFNPSPIFTPKDGIMWQLAKLQHQIADFAVVEIYEHLLRTHVRFEPFCVCLYRHLAPKHPLHQLLKFHCRGMIPTNSYGFPKLTSEKLYMHLLFAMGHVGTMKILNEGYKQMTWGDDDLSQNMKKRGLDDKNTLPFYPYRDDGEVIMGVLESFAKDFVDLYYQTDGDVLKDYELQNLVNEVSADGTTGPDAGKGRVKGLPAKLENKVQVSDLIKRIIWLVVQHAAVNYPIIAYGAFTPNMPTKLYENPNRPTQNILEALPKGTIAFLQPFVTLNLGTLRYDVMFDYFNHMDDKAAKYLVQKYYKKMMEEIKPVLTARNKARYDDGHLTYPYFVPGWLPNSIHT